MKFQFQSNPTELSYKPTLFTDAIKVLVTINFCILFYNLLLELKIYFSPFWFSTQIGMVRVDDLATIHIYVFSWWNLACSDKYVRFMDVWE